MESAPCFRLLKHHFTSPSKMAKSRSATEVFQSEYLSHAEREETASTLSTSVESKILPVFKTEPPQSLYLEFLFWACPKLILVL